MSMLCLAAGKILVAIPLASFTLAWTHSIEKTRWEEDWKSSGKLLVLSEARVKGIGAGMEPGASAVLRNGVWHYLPDAPPTSMLRLSHSPHAAGYELCLEGRCQALASLLPGIDDTTTIEISVCADTTKKTDNSGRKSAAGGRNDSPNDSGSAR